VDEPGPDGFPPGSPVADHAPMDEPPAQNGAPAGGALPGTLQALGLELGDDGIHEAPAGPPWAPAEKPPGGAPQEATDPAWVQDRDDAPPRRSSRPGQATDGSPPAPRDGTGR
jgi:hypothetical protein